MTQTTVVAPGWVCVGDLSAIAPAWVAALGELEDIGRSRTADAGTYSYRYADLADATSHARAILARHDLAVFQVPTIVGDDVLVRTTVMHSSGAHLVFDPFTLPAGRSAQQAGSAATYARRYSLMAQLGLATEDNDGATAGERTAPPTLSASNVTRFLDASTELTAEERADVVREATGGRTDNPHLVHASEVKALREALAAALSDSTPGVSQRAEEEPAGDGVEVMADA